MIFSITSQLHRQTQLSCTIRGLISLCGPISLTQSQSANNTTDVGHVFILCFKNFLLKYKNVSNVIIPKSMFYNYASGNCRILHNNVDARTFLYLSSLRCSAMYGDAGKCPEPEKELSKCWDTQLGRITVNSEDTISWTTFGVVCGPLGGGISTPAFPGRQKSPFRMHVALGRAAASNRVLEYYSSTKLLEQHFTTRVLETFYFRLPFTLPVILFSCVFFL